MTAAGRRGLLSGMAKEVDDGLALLRRLGWSPGQYATATVWCVEASRGGVLVLTTAPTQADAWRAALTEALGRTRPNDHER